MEIYFDGYCRESILPWRGKGKFRENFDVASNPLVGLILTDPQTEEDKVIFPDENKIIDNKFDLDWYLVSIFNSFEEFGASRFDSKDPVFNDQETYLKNIPAEKFNELIAAFEAVNETIGN